MTDAQRNAVADRAVRAVRGNRRLRRAYGLGWLDLVIVLSPLVIDLIGRILAILRDRESAGERYGAARFDAYRLIAPEGHDAELVAIVEDAEIEVVGP